MDDRLAERYDRLGEFLRLTADDHEHRAFAVREAVLVITRLVELCPTTIETLRDCLPDLYAAAGVPQN